MRLITALLAYRSVRPVAAQAGGVQVASAPGSVGAASVSHQSVPVGAAPGLLQSASYDPGFFLSPGAAGYQGGSLVAAPRSALQAGG
ncbi:hypothetical protein MTR62_11150, partial [Novosphingobium sp. 1949]